MPTEAESLKLEMQVFFINGYFFLDTKRKKPVGISWFSSEVRRNEISQ
jgi:hypothetical protein